MKKIATLFLCSFIALGFASCGVTSSSNTPTTEEIVSNTISSDNSFSNLMSTENTSINESEVIHEVAPNQYYDYNGKLHVEGINLKNAKGEIVQLNGVCCPMSSLEPRTQWKELDRMEQLKTWGFNHLRMGYSVSRPISEEMIDDMVDIADLLTSLGFYMEIVAFNDDTRIDEVDKYNASKDFLLKMVTRLKDQDNIIYTVGNEPSTGITMAMIDDYAKPIIDEILLIKEDALIGVPTPYACSEVDDCVYSTLTYPNIIYVNHCYQSMKNKCYDVYRRIQTAIANNKCILMSEWCAATPSSSEDYINTDEASNTAYLINKYHIANSYYNYYPGCDIEGVEGPSLNHLGMIKQIYWRNDVTNEDALTIGGKWAVGLLKNPITTTYGVNDMQLHSIINNGVNGLYSIWDEQTRTKIQKLSFGTMENKPQTFKEAWNLTPSGLGDITAYAMELENGLLEMRILSSELIYLPENSGSMFKNFTELEEITFQNVNTSKVTNMGFMFANDAKLKKIDFTPFDTSSVTNMWAMFANTSSMGELDLSMFDTSSLTNMTGMFQSCAATKIDLQNATFDNIVDKGYPFASCMPEAILVKSQKEKDFLLELKSQLKIEIINSNEQE